MLTTLPATIATIDEAKQFLNELHMNGETWHFEDDARDVIWTTSSPTETEAMQLNVLAANMLCLPDFCPFDYIIQLDNK